MMMMNPYEDMLSQLMAGADMGRLANNPAGQAFAAGPMAPNAFGHGTMSPLGGGGGAGAAAGAMGGISSLAKAATGIGIAGDLMGGLTDIIMGARGAKRQRKMQLRQMDMENRKTSVQQGGQNAQLLMALTALLAQRAGRLA